MTSEAQRIAIAEVRGWIFEKKKRDGMMSQIPAWHITTPGGHMRCAKAVAFHTSYGPDTRYEPFEGNLSDYLNECEVPDYPNDMNAMREAWLSLSYNQQAEFGHWLSVEVFGKGLADGMLLGEHDLSRLANATAAQRAKAFVRTLNLIST